jgi:hypothetical protein
MSVDRLAWETHATVLTQLRGVVETHLAVRLSDADGQSNAALAE